MTPEKARQKRIEKAAKEGRQFIPKKPTGIVAKDKAEWKREYKRMLRRKAGARLRSEMKKNADEKRKSADEKRAKRLHDSHVKRYHAVIYSREKYKKMYETNPEKERERQAKRKKALPDSYVIQNIVSMGISVNVVTPELIELKREAIQFKRMSKTIRKTVNDQLKEINETITKHP